MTHLSTAVPNQPKIEVIDGKLFTTSLDVAEKFGKQHKDVMKAIRNLEAPDDWLGRNFALKQSVVPISNGATRTSPYYEMTRDGFTFLVTGFTGKAAAEWKIKYIDAFNQMEKTLLATSPELEMAKGILAAQKLLEQKDNHILHLEARIEADLPKVLFADSVAASETCILIRELAKLISQNGPEIGEKRLFDWLRDNGYLIKKAGSDYNSPTQKAMDLGIFEIKETSITHSDGRITISRTPKVTGKGQRYFMDKFLAKERKVA